MSEREPKARSIEDWARELDCSPARAQQALDLLAKRGLIGQMLPALTVWQPWASLIAAGAKPFEWRGHSAPPGFWDRRIAIHAGARKVKPAEIADLILQLRAEGAAGTSLVPEIALPLLEKWHTSPGMLPLSSVLCTAILGKPITAAEYVKRHWVAAADSDRIDHMKWGWPLTDIQVLEPFVPAKDAQGFWSWSP